MIGEEAFMVRCVDKRYTSFGVRSQLPRAYETACAGASLWFNERPAFRAECYAQIKALRSLGVAIRTFFVADHFHHDGGHGCKAYEKNDSRARHEINLRMAADLIASESGLEELVIALLLHDIERGQVLKIPVSEPIAEVAIIGG